MSVDDEDGDDVGEHEEGLAAAGVGGEVVGGGGRSSSAEGVRGSCKEIREPHVAARRRSGRPELAPGQPPYLA